MRTILLLFCSGILFVGCKEDPIPVPEAALLLSPLNNTTCLSIPQGNTNAVVNFQWNMAENADRYSLVIRNAVTNEEQTSQTEETTTTASLAKGAPYSWKIISLSDDTTETAVSATWSFYLEATQQYDYIPLPAQLLSPEDTATATVQSGNVTLSWTGRDLDNDIVGYDVYLGPAADQLQRVESSFSGSTVDVAVNPSTTYFWEIATHDQNGNVSFSGIRRFQTP